MANIILQAQNQIMSASKEDIYCLLAYLHILQGDRLCTDDEYQTMLNDVNHARDIAYQMVAHGDANIIHAYLNGRNVDTVIQEQETDWSEYKGDPEDRPAPNSPWREAQ